MSFKSSLAASTRSKSPAPISRKGKVKEGEDEGEFLKEAYRILLASVRKAYLSTVEPPPLSRRPKEPERNVNGDAKVEEEWARWEKVKYLTDKERDEIDLRARMILRRCQERIGILEVTEQKRKSKVISSAKPTSTFLSLLPSLASSSISNFEPILSAHHASILWTLNEFLARLTGAVSDLQTERVKRREERSKTLGAGATLEAQQLGLVSHARKRSIPEGLITDVHDPAFSHTIGKDFSDPHLSHGLGIIDPSAPAIDQLLSQEQIRTFESENNALLEHMSSTLSSVLSAEASLLEISQLQSELIRHLAQQTEMVEQLYEDAVGSVAEVKRANEQLTKARERGKDGRLFLLIFILGASFSLLFLDWYAA
ncbi:syntaxin 18 [Cryptococcus bacillisporus CA1873]|uniref:Syntaxin 18 n=1 Tax=Cryptococcus bacillisporus CA1873 TaxID=1296111 RepID=A0ABR5BCK7_CRYGA|nr:syntaxin 18 [Cryptococcus bacillisporus CA1873]|eukprot:KIR64037.1 syntaxin 18 [Cryptococcus gattii CA1873]